MAVDGRMRRRSRPMPTSSKMMKPSGGIRGVVNSGAGSRSGKCADHGIRTHAGASASVGNIVKPDVVDSSVKPSSVDSDEEEWIYIRGCRIHRAGLRFDSKGEVYVPDSEDDESSVEVNHVVATNGATDVDLAPAVKCSLFMVCINRKYCYKLTGHLVHVLVGKCILCIWCCNNVICNLLMVYKSRRDIGRHQC